MIKPKFCKSKDSFLAVCTDDESFMIYYNNIINELKKSPTILNAINPIKQFEETLCGLIITIRYDILGTPLVNNSDQVYLSNTANLDNINMWVSAIANIGTKREKYPILFMTDQNESKIPANNSLIIKKQSGFMDVGRMMAHWTTLQNKEVLLQERFFNRKSNGFEASIYVSLEELGIIIPIEPNNE